MEVYCNTCGEGLCSETIVKGHDYPQFRVNLCPQCENRFKDEISELNDEIRKLEQQLSKYE